MKKLITGLLVLAMVLGLCACGGKEGAGKTFDKLHVGVSRQDITPDKPIGCHINGGGDPNRLAEGILDDLTITCIAITDKTGNTVLIYSQDIHNPVPSFTDAARQAISDATGVPYDNIYMTATHTHSSLMPTDASQPGNVEFTAKYDAAVVAAAKAAMEDRAPAQMYCSEADVKELNGGQALAFVRHYSHKDGSVAGSNFGKYNQAMMNGFPYESDNGAQLVKFVREGEGKNPVLLMNWGAHSTFHGTTALRNISADYPAYVRHYIEDNTDYTFAICLSGAGDQTPNASLYPPANHGLECEDYGAALGKIIADYTAVDANFTKVEDGAIKQKRQVITVQTNKIPEELMDLAAQANEVYQYFLENGQAEGTTYAVSKGFQSCYEARSFVGRANLPDTLEIPIDVMSIGNLAFAIAGWEMAGKDSARVIKDAFKDGQLYDMAFIMAYCNDNLGYIPAISNFEYNGGRGSYEAYDCHYAKGTCEQLAESYIQLLKDLKAE